MVTRAMTDRLLANEQFRLALEAAPTAMLLVDELGRIALVNAHAELVFGYARPELIGLCIDELVPEQLRTAHAGHRGAFHRNPRARPMGTGELMALRRDGSEVPVEVALNPIETPQGRRVLVSVVDVTQRREARWEREALLSELKQLNAELEERVAARTADLSATLRERDVLLQEIHHRVKNNLYVISSLIEMQARLLEEPKARNALEDCQARVHAIALIHEKLYQSKDYANVPFSQYVRGLAGDIFHAMGASQSTISLELAIDDVALAVDKAIPCGLILNELVGNALKHAFPDGRDGKIRVELRAEMPRKLILAVSDDGVGLPGSFDLQKTQSLGLQLVNALVRQLDAGFLVRREPGTRFELAIPMED